MTTYLVDNSIWQKAGSSTAIADRLRALSPNHLIITCPRKCSSTATPHGIPANTPSCGKTWTSCCRRGSTSDEHAALDIQQALWDAGFIRAAAAFHCLIAAYAVANDAVILNSDRDFGYIELATDGRVRQEYVAA